MVNYKSNQPYYKLSFSSLAEDELQVLSFEGEEVISRLFEYRFELISKNPEIEADDVLNKTATFELIRGDDDPVYIHGIISHFEQHEQSYGKKPDYTYYEAVLVPKFWRLTLNYKSVIFQKMDIQTLINKVLEDAGMISDDYRFDLNASYPEMEYAVQYRETDFDFINRRCEHFGIFYYFDHSGGTDVLVFTDSNDSLPAVESSEDLLYNPASQKITDRETITRFSFKQKVVTGLVKLKDYNYRQPNTSLLVEEQIDTEAPGEFYDYGDHYKDVSEGEFLAKIRNEEIICGSKIFLGTSDCKLLHCGHTFRMSEHYRSGWNAEMVITRLISQGDQRALFAYVPTNSKRKFYENQFTAIPMEHAFRPKRTTPIPQVSGIMTARMESGSGDEYAYLDDQGRYRVKMHFDLSDESNGKASRQIRMSQPYSGAGYGIHFPNHADTEMVWACINGNADRPLALGTVPNPSNTSPSTSSNKAQSVIRTAAQNELTFDDTTGSENIFLHGTKDWTIEIANDKNQTVGNNETLQVGTNRDKSVGANQSETIGANKTISVGANHNETIAVAKIVSIGAAYQITVGAAMNESIGALKAEEIGANKIVSVGSNSSEEVGKNKTVKVGSDYSTSVDKNYTCQVKENVTVESDKKMIFNSKDDFGIKGDKKGVIEIKDQLQIKCGKAMMTMKKNGDITIQGKNINLKGSGNIVIKAKKIMEN